jgi:hypothetical protein
VPEKIVHSAALQSAAASGPAWQNEGPTHGDAMAILVIILPGKTFPWAMAISALWVPIGKKHSIQG